MKAYGFPFLATIGVIISAITNVVLDYIFVIKLGYGIRGAAVATDIAQLLISYNFGAEQSKNILYLLKLGLNTVLITSVTVFSVSLLFANNITSLFINPNEIELFNNTV